MSDVPGTPPAGEPRPEAEDSGEPIGPFPTWKALYTTVLIYTGILVVLLYVFTVVFDRSVG